MMRVGCSYDVHRLEEGRDLILGGVRIDHSRGLLGHSDADIVCHSVIDALLGAAALGDIGTHFPPSDEKWKDANSVELLREAVELLHHSGYRVGNVDVTVVAQEPKLKAHIPSMRENLANVLAVPVNRVSVKATTSEHLGFIGRGEAMAAYAVALIEER